MISLVCLLLCFSVYASELKFSRWGTIFKQGQLSLQYGVRGPNNGSYIVARWVSDNGTFYGLAQLDSEEKALGRFPGPDIEETPAKFQILLEEDDGIYYTWIPVTDYLSTPGYESISSEVNALPFAKSMPDGDVPLGHWNPDIGLLPTNGSVTTFHGVECETGWVLVLRRVGSVQIDLLPLDPSSAVATSEDVEVISGDFYNQASNSQRWKWDVNYEAISSNSFTMPDLSRAVPFTFNAKELRRAWGKVDKKPFKPTVTGPNTTVATSTPEIITAAMANLPSVPLTDTFVLPPSTVNSGAHETLSRVNRTFSATIEVDPYTLMSAEARVTRVRITIPYWATQKTYDINGVLLDTKKINGTYKSVSTVLSRISLREPNTPCDRGFYGFDGTCYQCPPGSTSPPRSRTALSCRCDTEGGYAGTSSCTGCGADTYATSSGCLPCPTGCNSPPFSSRCDCSAALNVQASNNMRASTIAAYPGFTAQEKKVVFAFLIIIGIVLVGLSFMVIYLWRNNRPFSTTTTPHHLLPVHHHQTQDDFYPTSSTPTTHSKNNNSSSISVLNHPFTDRRRNQTPPLLTGGGEGGRGGEMSDDTPRVRPAFQNNGSQV